MQDEHQDREFYEHRRRHDRMTVTKIVTVIIGAVIILLMIGLWQNHTNSLAYRLRNCPETSDNSGYIGFTCTDKSHQVTQIFVPQDERDQVKNVLSPADKGDGNF